MRRNQQKIFIVKKQTFVPRGYFAKVNFCLISNFFEKFPDFFSFFFYHFAFLRRYLGKKNNFYFEIKKNEVGRKVRNPNFIRP